MNLVSRIEYPFELGNPIPIFPGFRKLQPGTRCANAPSATRIKPQGFPNRNDRPLSLLGSVRALFSVAELKQQAEQLGIK